ncbi:MULTISPECIES: hypothetical protein [unclassified Carboxylicivirga]|uniref:hypothetical protein n=1 Tax=Carboxylicivirga TaxID=1628153 RepID=UPI003D344E01
MIKYILSFAALISAPLLTSAQTVKAITQYGKTVILYENGTWKYEKDTGTPAVSAPTTETKPATESKPRASLSISSDKEASSEKMELCNAVSKRLARFFGEEKGRVRCMAAVTNNKGEISINFEFMMPIGDANRYFGYTAMDRPITLSLADGRSVSGTFTNTEEKFIDKWNVSYYKTQLLLSKDDIVHLMESKAMRMTIDWKKLEEEYQIEDTRAIQQMLLEVL